MKRERVGKHFALAFAFAALIYLVAFYGVEYLRTRKGGWQLEFRADEHGSAAVRVDQPYLSISNVQLQFPGSHVDHTNWHATLRFDQPLTNIPFGQVVYLDTTFLPGAIVMSLFGHEVQLLPRVLLVDHREIPWRSGLVLPLPAGPGH